MPSLGGNPATLLHSWKEIAAYLGRDVRTVMRWAKDKGLPVHRLPGGARAAVFAYREEMDAWLLGLNDSVGAANAETITPPTPNPRRRSRGYGIAATFALSVFAVLILSAFWIPTGTRQSSLPLQFTRVDYAAAEPMGIAAADFNNDGLADLIVANAKSEKIEVLLGNGDGTFSRHESVNVAGGPSYFAIADFNGDGNLDVALHVRTTGVFHVLSGDGHGNLRETFTMALPGGDKGMATADLNHDGKPDIVIVQPGRKAVAVLLGNGDGTFREGPLLEAAPIPAMVAFGDFNRDGHIDLVFCDYNIGTGNTVSVYLGKGDGTFGARRSYLTGGGPLHVAVGDVNEDGIVDIVTANFQDRISVLLGKGDGTFGEPRHFDAGKANTFVALVDLNGDGHVDVLSLGMHDDSLAYLRGYGDGTFAPPELISTGRYPDVIAVADMNRDGKLDIAVSNSWGNSFAVFLNRSESRRGLWATASARWLKK
jgi:FG-GAP-like repeat